MDDPETEGRGEQGTGGDKGDRQQGDAGGQGPGSDDHGSDRVVQSQTTVE